jgi:ferredoxin-NADP reductase
MSATPSAVTAHTAPAVSADALVVAAKRLVARDVMSVVLRRPDGSRLPDWTPGAHIDLVMADGLTRQYSLCGEPRNAHEYRIAVRREDAGGGGSAYIHDTLREGDGMRFGGPRNNFRLAPSPRYSFVAGGIGITPLLPMIRAAAQMGADWRLLYCGREVDSMAFADALPAGGEVIVHESKLHGRMNLAAWLGEFRADTKVYACGPEALIDGLRAETHTWTPGWVRFERFTELDRGAPSRTTPFEVAIAGSDRVVTVTPDVSVATALRDAGFDLLTSCSRGVCGTCETAVVAGEPDHRDSVLDDADRAASSTFFPCVSRSRGDRITLAL